MEQYPIPQFIEEEGKIIYFITFRQFFILIAGGAICFFLYFILPSPLSIVAIILVGCITGVVCFVKINDMKVEVAFLHFLNFSVGSKNYTWKKTESPYPFKIQKRGELKEIEKDVTLSPQKSKLHDIKKNVELNVK